MTAADIFKIGVNRLFIVAGMRGRVGDFVFRQLNGVTVCSRRPKKPTSQTDDQRETRSKFKLASAFAKALMKDPEKKAYYTNIAHRLRLPNGYTAAIKEFMNRPLEEHPKEDVRYQESAELIGTDGAVNSSVKIIHSTKTQSPIILKQRDKGIRRGYYQYLKLHKPAPYQSGLPLSGSFSVFRKPYGQCRQPLLQQ